MTDVKTAFITRDIVENAYDYGEYKQMVDELLNQNKTTGENHSEAMLHYTKMNVHRMKRLDEQIHLKEELLYRLKNLDRPMIWLALTEGWSGDAAQIIPVIQRMADQSKKVQARYILRDKNLDVMSKFLTDNRSRAIPKLICLDSQTLEILGEWGPRPREAQQLFKDLRNSGEYSSRNTAERLRKWYSDDKTDSIQDEFISLIEEWSNRD